MKVTSLGVPVYIYTLLDRPSYVQDSPSRELKFSPEIAPIAFIRSCAKTQWYSQTSQPPASPSQFPRPRFHAHLGSSYWR